MLEAASILAAYLAFALIHVAATDVAPWLAWLRKHPAGLLLTRVSAGAVFVVSMALWPGGDVLTSILASSLALLGSASVTILFAPIVPRLVYGLAAAAPAVIAIFAWGCRLAQ